MTDHGNSGTGGAWFDTPRCEWNLTGGFPIKQCPEAGTEDRDGERWLCTRVRAALVDE